MHAAVDDALPELRRYLRAKASLHCDTEGLHWSDLSAPGACRFRSRDQWEHRHRARARRLCYLKSVFVALAHTAVRDAWIDAESRPAKERGPIAFRSVMGRPGCF